MAANYTLTKLEDETLVLSQTLFEDGTTVGFVTHPHEIPCQVTLPKAQVDAIGYDTVAQPLAFNIERLLTDGTAVGAAYLQLTDASGLLADAMNFTVSVPGTDFFAGGTLSMIVQLTIKQLYLLSDNLHLFDEAKTKLAAAQAL